MAKLIPMMVALLVMTVGRSEAIRWDKQPDKPTILVEGVNNTGESLKLVWTFVTEPSEFIDRVTFQRRRDDADPSEDIATNKEGGAFNVFPKFISNYSASIPATLILRNPVTNDGEFIYSIVVSLSKNNLPEPSLTDQVQLIVFVPPRITTEPERESKVSVGENLMLTCSASGDPFPEVTWSKEGKTLRLFNVTGPVLHLVNITREDVGSYKCTAKNKVGEASRPALVNIACPENQCEDHEFGIRITNIRWMQAFNNSNAIEYKALKSNVISQIARIYSQSQNSEKQLYGITIVEFREGSTIAIVRLRFERNISDPLKPLEDAIKDGILGRNIRVDTQLLNTKAIRWDKQPDKPTILVEGVNNTGESLKLVWTFVTEPSEFIDRVTFQRRRDDADPSEDIATNKEGGAFNVFPKFISNYSASIPATLILRNPVTNDGEFIYSIVVSLSKNNLPEPSLTDQVQLIVFGK
ncbi:uncharacterized protein [Porites lutea]|uniref:uncharacterized protein n=1 Tax=Porites lutea TaxID=51062 RepID=UPI003CC68F7E